MSILGDDPSTLRELCARDLQDAGFDELRNHITGRRMGPNCENLKQSAPMSPAEFYEVYEKSGGILNELAKQCDVPHPTLQFNKSADAPSPSAPGDAFNPKPKS